MTPGQRPKPIPHAQSFRFGPLLCRLVQRHALGPNREVLQTPNVHDMVALVTDPTDLAVILQASAAALEPMSARLRCH